MKLAEAFDGTAQPGSTLPIYYGEFGVESLPPEAKRSLYEGEEPTTTKPVNERTQAAYYRGARLAFCQTNVKGLLLFLNVDDPDLPAGSPASTTRTRARSRRWPASSRRPGRPRAGSSPSAPR